MRDGEFAFVTPSFPPDAHRCELLVDSLDRCCPQVKHYLIIDSRDVGAFAHLASDRTIIVESERLIEPWLRRFPTRHGYWVSLRSFPTRGWIMQQIRKIAAATVLPYDSLVFCDSDLSFIRPFSTDALLVDGRPGLLEVPYVDDNIRRWTRRARSLLGLPEQEAVECSHVGQLVCWRRATAERMAARLSSVGRRSWQLSLARQASFSEYVLYGTFVRECLGYEAAGQSPSQIPLVRTSWDRDITHPEGLDGLFEDLDPRTIAVMAHSKDRFDMGRHRQLVERQWKLSGAA